jgi:tol-pal system protein YbgF
LFVATLAAPATAGFAQTSDTTQLIGRINQLENQIQTLSRTVYRGQTPPASMEAAPLSGAPSGAIADFEVRLSQLEQQQRDVTGQLERIGHDVQQLKERVEKTLADNELRFQQLEGRGGPPTTYVPAEGGAPGAPGEAVLTGDMYAGESVSGGTLGTLSTSGSSPADALYASAFDDIRESRYDAAEAKLKQFMSKYASHPLAANAQYWLAETFYVRGDYRQSARMFAQGYQDYPQGQKAPDSLLKLGLSLSKLGKKEDACLSFAQLKKEFPGDASPVIRRAEQEMKQIGC